MGTDEKVEKWRREEVKKWVEKLIGLWVDRIRRGNEDGNLPGRRAGISFAG